MTREKEVSVTFRPENKVCHVLPGTRLIEAAAVAGIVLDAPCGGEGTCGKCRIRIVTAPEPPCESEQRLIRREELDAGIRLACQTIVRGPMVVEVPSVSQAAAFQQILTRDESTAIHVVDPVVRKTFVELPAPSRHDDVADQLRLERSVGPFSADLAVIRTLAARLRENAFRGTAVLIDGELIDFELGNTASQAYAVAVDVGTTTLVAQLIDLASGVPCQTAARLNSQTRFGDDVLSRILFAARQPDGLAQLRQAVAEAIDAMIGELAENAQIDRQSIYDVALAGNTTMQQLLCGLDPAPLGQVPFVATLGRSLDLRASDLGISVHPRGRAVIFSTIGGFVGGDTVAGILATKLNEAAAPTLFVDIGTNGEIVLAAGGKLWAASTAAGPAFEGARILHGMRGCTGAIEKVVHDDRLRFNVIGDVPPLGICGSGLIDVAAELLRHRLISPEGRLLPLDELPSNVPPELASRLVEHDCRHAFQIADAEESGTGAPILLTQRDVRELQLATGAIRAGIHLLLQRAGLTPADLDRVLIAGGFGNFIRRNNAQRIGLLPNGVPHARIRYQGNVSLAGARLAAISQKARRLADQIASRVEHVDLGDCPGFADAFSDAMIFPEEEGC